jgi:hypothetical protein
MGSGYLRVKAVMADGAMPVEGAEVVIKDSYGRVLYRLKTGASGETEDMALNAPDKSLTMAPGFTGVPYSVYRVEVRAPGLITEIRNYVQIFDTIKDVLNIEMSPALPGSLPTHEIDIPPHSLLLAHPHAIDEAGSFESAQGVPVYLPVFFMNLGYGVH